MGERADGDRSKDRGRERDKGGAAATAARQVPKDAHAVMAMLKEMGVHEYDPRVVCQLLEFAHRYVGAVLEDARAFAAHAKKKTVEVEDVRLAAAAQLERGFTAPPPREVLLELTRGKNLTPLPLVKPHCGLRLPPDRYCLSSCNYKLGRAPPRRPQPKPGQKPTHSAVAKKPGGPLGAPRSLTPNAPKPTFKYAAAPLRQPGKPVRMEIDGETVSLKREREDDDYDAA